MLFLEIIRDIHFREVFLPFLNYLPSLSQRELLPFIEGFLHSFEVFIIIDDPKARVCQTLDDFDYLLVRFLGTRGLGEECRMVSAVGLSWDGEHRMNSRQLCGCK